MLAVFLRYVLTSTCTEAELGRDNDSMFRKMFRISCYAFCIPLSSVLKVILSHGLHCLVFKLPCEKATL